MTLVWSVLIVAYGKLGMIHRSSVLFLGISTVADKGLFPTCVYTLQLSFHCVHGSDHC